METNGSGKGEEHGKGIVVILVGAPGSGKSTFCETVMKSASRPWLRVCQDTIGNGKAGTKAQCLKSAVNALSDGRSVFIDRCNLDREQRAEFVKLGGPNVDVHAVVLDLPAKVCISRSVKRSGHEGNLQGGKAAVVVNRMLQKKEWPKLSEGFSRITFCQNDSDVQSAINTYIGLGPSDTLPSGCFGQKNQDGAKIQLGIMKFLKKVEVPDNLSDKKPICKAPENVSSLSRNIVEEGKEGGVLDDSSVKEPTCIVSENVSSLARNVNEEVKEGGDVPSLAFPSISTSDFQFNLEKASDIIVEKVEEFVNKIGNARLVLVDLSRGSKILSLVKAKAAQKNIDSNKFLTFVGDITRLYSQGGLRCNVIANAANWRLKPGGGGTNAAIYSAAGPALEVATKERAKSLNPGNALVVPLPSTSPLFEREGVTHVIHVLGPNMNPQRPNCLDNDYIEGCKVLRETYSSLFEGFVSIARNQSSKSIENSSKVHFPIVDQKSKRGSDFESERNKKSKRGPDEVEEDRRGQIDGGSGKAWGTWAQALYHIAMNPERHVNDLLEITEDVVVMNDLYPKAQKHLLVLSRSEGLDRLADARKEHLQLLKTMHAIGLKWAEKFVCEDSSLVFRLGYHSAPSMRQLHLHIISQDFDSIHLKNKKHWNSFNSAFFLDSIDVIKEITTNGKANLKDEESLLSMELRCNRCKSAHPNIPRLKSHISSCRAPFPSTLLQNGHLVVAPMKASIDS